ncbi:rhodanese-like domain-containing protein [Namhaeicola litoreus]|uniref:Rhodanese-like domain-containing protein n=1 Tax=Namhaeicola litoreus TaxID=1052145 RepID=A0ABW3Y4Y9_9FLAO
MSTDYKFKKFLTRRYQLLAGVLVLLAAGLVLLPEHPKNEGISPELFVNNVLSDERFISSDELVDRIINKDPSMILVDVRTDSEFKKFTLPGSVNIPLESFLNEEYASYFDQNIYDIILFSNDNFMANEAWLLGNRMGFNNLYVLKGGLNDWFETIFNPTMPPETASKEAFDLYDFRKAAALYFGIGGYEKEIKPVVKKISQTPKKVSPAPKKKKAVPEGGC